MIRTYDILKVSGEFINFDKIKSIAFKNVVINSREVHKGDIFFAIKGETNDGHNYVKDVIKKGAAITVVNRKWYSLNKNKFKHDSFVVVKDTTAALGELAYIYKNKMNIPIFGVAGSNGKTTTKDLICEVLSKKFKVHKTAGNYNNHIGLPLTLLGIKENDTFCVAELGSNHFGELEYLCKIAQPDFALVTNIGKEHLEFFKNLKGVSKEEFTIYDYVCKNGSVCFFNLDDEFIRDYRKSNKCNSFTYSYKHNSEVRGLSTSFNKEFHPVIEYKYSGKKYKLVVNTFGRHSFYNGLAAIAAGLYFGIKHKDIADALANLSGLSQKRMEVKDYYGVKVVNDAYNSNPDSVVLGLETINDFKCKGKKHVVLSDMLEMGKSSEREHYEIGKLIKTLKFDFVYTYGPLSYNIFKGSKGYNNNFYFDSKDELTEFLRLNLRKGDIAYFKGSRGMKIEEVINNLFNKNRE